MGLQVELGAAARAGAIVRRMPLASPTRAPSRRDLTPAEVAVPPWHAPMSTGELLVAWGCLALLGALVFLPHALHGGLYLDDWAKLANTVDPPSGRGVWSIASEEVLISGRPVLAVFSTAKYVILGTDVRAILSVAIALTALVSMLAYAVLRILGVPWYHAWLISALTLAYPWYDSTRFWDSATPISLAVALAFAGLWMALIGLDRNSWRFHIAAAFLYLLSMLTYEITLPFVAMAGLLYTARTGWRIARMRWATDLIVVVAAGAWIRTHTPKTVSGLASDASHLHQIVSKGGELLARSILPVGQQPHIAIMLTVLAAVFTVGTVVHILRPRAAAVDGGWGLHQWLLIGLAGMLVATLGWAIFVPADPYYTPSIFGVTNRVNGLAGFGLVITVYAALGVIGSLIALAGRTRPRLAVGVTVSLALMLGATYLHVLERHSRIWSDAYRYELTAAKRIRAAFPHLSHDAVVYAADYPANIAPGVTIFSTTWDLDGMVKLTYGDPTLRAYPITETLGVECRPNGARAVEDGIPSAPYRDLRMVDLRTGRTATPSNRQECLKALVNFPPGPLYLSTAY